MYHSNPRKQSKTPNDSFLSVMSEMYRLYDFSLNNTDNKKVYKEFEESVENCLPISFKDFEAIINSILDFWYWSDKLYKLGVDITETPAAALESQLVNLLTYIMGDEKDRWIEYYLYELEAGEKYVEGTITHSDGRIIPLKTTEDLWNLLTKELQKMMKLKRKDRIES